MKKQSIIIYDLETDNQDPNIAVPKIMGFKSSEVDGFRWTTSIAQMCDILQKHDVIVGYNHREYDNKIMMRFGAQLQYKIQVDLMEIIHGKGFGNDKGRKGILTTKDGTQLGTILHGKSLAETTKALDGPLKVGDFDYNLFKKPFEELSKDEQREALEYLEADIDATQYIYDYIEEYFKDFKEGGIEMDGEFKPFMNEEQVKKKQYLTASTASFTYKSLCNLAGLEEKYSNGEGEEYGGGFVALPTQETCTGKIYCLDYASLYPHIMIQANLYGQSTHMDNGWNGQGISKTEGIYNVRTLAPVGRVLKELYAKRLQYKEDKDEKQYTIKIIINTIYGLLGNPAFASVCNFTAAADCTRLGRQWIKVARLKFKEAGYNVLYTDTDSVYLEDVFNNEKKLMQVKDEHIQDIKKSVPFPQETFDMTVDDRITFMAFVKSKHTGEYLKKNYLYITESFTDKHGVFHPCKLKVKGMQIIKSNCTPLSKKIFNEHIKPAILESQQVKFKKTDIEQWMFKALQEDITLAAVFYKIKPVKEYKLASQIQSQISAKYGEGQYYLLKLKNAHSKAAGINCNYLDIKYASEVGLGALDLTKSWAELEPFIAPVQKGLEEFW